MSNLLSQLKAATLLVVSGATDAKAHSIFGGKTFIQVVEEFGIDSDSVKVLYVDYNGSTGQALGLTINGIKYSVPFSRGFSDNGDVSYWANSRFYISSKNVWKRDENNRIVRDEDGNLVPTGKKEPYMSFGRPNGITILGEHNVFKNTGADAAKAGAEAATR